MKHSPAFLLLLRVVRIGAVVFATVFLAAGAFFALRETKGIDQGLWNVLSGSFDLSLRHNEVRLMLMGENVYQLALEDKVDQRAVELLGPGHSVDPDYFPSTLLPVLLMARWPFAVAKGVWLVVNLGAAVLLVCTLRWMMGTHRPSIADQMLATSLWICGIPFWTCLAMGQASIFSVAFVLAAFRADCSRRYWLAGLCLALGVFKYALIWPLILFLFILQWRWRSLLIGGGIHLVVHLVLCRIIQANPLTIFADVLGNNAKVFHYNSLLTFWLPFRSWNKMFPQFAVPAHLLGALLLGAVLAGLVWLWLRRKKAVDRHLLLWMAMFLLLAVVTVSSRIFAHMFALPVLMVACSPGSLPLSCFQRTRLIAFVLYLGYVPSGADDLGFSQSVQNALRLTFDVVLAALALDLGRLLVASGRSQPTSAAALRA